MRTLITVLFPAPFGPRNEKISPSFTAKLILSTAFTSPKKYSRLFTSMILFSRISTPSAFSHKGIESPVINRCFCYSKTLFSHSLKRELVQLYWTKINKNSNMDHLLISYTPL